MKKALLLGVLVLLAVGSVFAQWTLGPSSASVFTLWRFDGEYYPPTGMIYFLGGRNGDGTTNGEIYCFDPVADTFGDMGLTMEQPISNYNCNMLKDLTGPDSLALYTVGGRLADGTETPAIQAYYPISGLAMSLSSDPFPGRWQGQIFFPAQGQIALDNKLYVFGGYETATAPYNTDSTYVYDPSLPAGSRWSNITTAILHKNRGYITSAVADGKIYAIGGDSVVSSTSLHNTKIVERFDPAHPDSGWVRMADLPDTLSESQAFGFDTNSHYALAGHIIVAPRGCWPDPFTTCYDYNIATNTWSTFASVDSARRDHAGVFVPDSTGGTMWLFDGRKYTVAGDTATASTEYYHVALGVAEQKGVRQEIRTALQAPAPNPFNSRTVLRYSLAKSCPVSLVIYSITGQKVRTLVSGQGSAGTSEVAWDSRDNYGKPVGAGVYFVRFEAGGVQSTQRVTVLR